MTIARWRLAVFVAAVLALLALSTPTTTDLGWGYLARRDYERARASFAARLRGDATDREAWLGLAAAYGALGDPAREIQALEALARQRAGRREALEKLADVYEWNKDVDASVGALERLLAADVDAATGSAVRQRLLNLHAWAGRYDDVGRTLSALVAAPPASADAVEDAIGAARLLGRRRDVIAFATAWAEGNPRSIDAQRRLAYLHEAVGVPALARDRWLKIARLDPFDGEARDRLGPEGRAIWDAAVAAIERTRAEKPRDEAVRRRLVALYREVGEGARAIEVQRELAALRSEDRTQQLALARLLVEHDRATDAIPILEALVARADGADLFDDLAKLYEWTGQPARALALLERLAAARPDDRELAERLLTATEAKGDVAGALAMLDRLAARYPAEPRWAERAVDLLLGTNRIAEAIPRQRRLMEARGGALPDALKLAQLYEWTNQPAQALGLLDRLAAARPADRALGARVLALARGVGDTPRALAALERLAAQFPADPTYAEQTVELLLAENRLAEAIARQRRLAERDTPAALLRLAELHGAAGQEREAIAVYERLDARGALPPVALARLGDLYRFQNRPADFLRVAERRLRRGPQDDALRGDAAETAQGLGRFAEAAALLAPLVERRPADEALVLRYLMVTAQAGRIDDGLRAHRRHLAARGAPALDYRIRVARALVEVGRTADAIAEYEAVLAAGPADPVAVRLAVAQLYDWTAAPERALAQWEAVMRARPRDVTVLRDVGRRALALSRSDLSLRAWRALLAERPDDPEALKRTGQLLAWGNDPRGAKAALERLTRLRGAGDSEVHFLLGELYRAEHDEARARAEYEKALRLMGPRVR